MANAFKQLEDITSSASSDSGDEGAFATAQTPDTPQNEPGNETSFCDIETSQLRALDDRMRGHLTELQSLLTSMQSDPALKDDPHVAELEHQVGDLRANMAVVQRALASLNSADPRQQRTIRQRIRVVLPQLIQSEGLEFADAQCSGITAVGRRISRHAVEEEVAEHETRHHKSSSTLSRAISRLFKTPQEHEAPSWFERQQQRMHHFWETHLGGFEARRIAVVGWFGTEFSALGARVDHVVSDMRETAGAVAATVVQKGNTAASLVGEIARGNVLYGGAQIVKATIRNVTFGLIDNDTMNGAASAVSRTVSGVTNTLIVNPAVGIYTTVTGGISNAYHAVFGGGETQRPIVPVPTAPKLVVSRPAAPVQPVRRPTQPAHRPGAQPAHVPSMLESIASYLPHLPHISLPWEQVEGASAPAATPGGWHLPNLLAIG